MPAVKKTDKAGPKTKKHTCSMVRVQYLIGGKWKLILLWRLSLKTWRFNELRREMPEISQRVLTSQLRDLERDGFVRRKIYREIPPKVEYSLTPKGKSLEPLFDWMCDWGHKHLPPEK